MNTRSKYLVLLLIPLLLISCGNDDEAPQPTDDMGETLEEERAMTISNLTADGEKLWKISAATLTNTNGTYDMTGRYNIEDDEFLFGGDATSGSLRWSPGYALNLDASNTNDTAIDYYLSPETYVFTFNEDSSNELTSIDGQLVFTVLDDETITGTITFAGRSAAGELLEVTLAPKTTADFSSPPSNGLVFEQVTLYDDLTISGATIFSESAAGIIGSYSDNSLFVVCRGFDGGNNTSELIYKYSLDGDAWSVNLYNQQQFITKRLNIINNELVAFGGQIATTYPLELGLPNSEFQHDLAYTRFGFAVQGDFGYVVEGSTEQGPLPPSNILKYNYLDNSITQIGTLPKARLYGGSEIVNDKLYVFGGRNEFIDGALDAESFIYDLQDNSVSSFMMPDAPRMSFAAKNGTLIYVGYTVADQNGQSIKFGVYDTAANTFSPIADNLDDSSGIDVIEGITVFNGFLYAIYGNSQENIMRIFRAPL